MKAEAIYTHPVTKMNYRLHDGKYQYWRRRLFICISKKPKLERGKWIDSGLKRGFKLKNLFDRQEMLVAWHYQHCLAQAGLV